MQVFNGSRGKFNMLTLGTAASHLELTMADRSKSKFTKRLDLLIWFRKDEFKTAEKGRVYWHTMNNTGMKLKTHLTDINGALHYDEADTHLPYNVTYQTSSILTLHS